MRSRGIRGATTAAENSEEVILSATRELLEELVAANDLRVDDIVSVIFTATTDLNKAHPARAARQLGWSHVPLLCMQEMEVAPSLARCIRVLIHWNTDKPTTDIRHVYLHGAEVLRPDLAQNVDGTSRMNQPGQSRREPRCQE